MDIGRIIIFETTLYICIYTYSGKVDIQRLSGLFDLLAWFSVTERDFGSHSHTVNIL